MPGGGGKKRKATEQRNAQREASRPQREKERGEATVADLQERGDDLAKRMSTINELLDESANFITAEGWDQEKYRELRYKIHELSDKLIVLDDALRSYQRMRGEYDAASVQHLVAATKDIEKTLKDNPLDGFSVEILMGDYAGQEIPPGSQHNLEFRNTFIYEVYELQKWINYLTAASNNFIMWVDNTGNPHSAAN